MGDVWIIDSLSEFCTILNMGSFSLGHNGASCSGIACGC